MESTRQSKIARLIQKELSEIFLLQAKAMNGVLVSVTSQSSTTGATTYPQVQMREQLT